MAEMGDVIKKGAEIGDTVFDIIGIFNTVYGMFSGAKPRAEMIEQAKALRTQGKKEEALELELSTWAEKVGYADEMRLAFGISNLVDGRKVTEDQAKIAMDFLSGDNELKLRRRSRLRKAYISELSGERRQIFLTTFINGSDEFRVKLLDSTGMMDDSMWESIQEADKQNFRHSARKAKRSAIQEMRLANPKPGTKTWRDYLPF